VGVPARGGLPPRSRRGMPVLAQVFLWGFVGLAALVALGFGLLSLLVTGRTWAPRPPGEPVLLADTDLVGVWSDGDGGRLTINADGTFAAHRLCGEYLDWPDGASEPRQTPPEMSGKGNWRQWTVDQGTDEERQYASEVQFEFDATGISFHYDATGTAGEPLLSTYQGDPDEGDLCVLFRPDRRDGAA
jgi:hypothetical protein